MAGWILEPLCGVGIEVHAVDAFQVGDGRQRSLAMRARGHLTLLTGYRLKGVQDNLLQQLAERHVLEFSQAFEDLHEPSLHPDAELYPLDWQAFLFRILLLWSHGTMVPWDMNIGVHMTELSLEAKSARYEEIEETFLAELNQSLRPRGSDMLHDLVAELDLPAGAVVLDAGCGKGRHAVALARRFDVRVIGIDPAPIHLDLAATAVAAAESTTPGLSARIELGPGRVEQLPLDASSVDLVWCRDVLGAVEDLDAAYREFARVLRPEGRAIIYQSGLAPDLTALEAERFAALDGPLSSADPARIEAAITASGLRTDRQFSVGLEWAEHHAETTGKGPSRLLHLARLLREPEHCIERFGRWEYDVMVADCYWHLWRLMGKLDERVYLLTKPT